MVVDKKFLLINVSLIVFVLISYFLRQMAGILIPTVLGIILGLIFAPMLVSLRKRNVPMPLTLIIIIVFFLVGCLMFSSILVSSLYSISGNFLGYQEKISNMIALLTAKMQFLDAEILNGTQEYIFAKLQENIFNYSRSVFGFVTRFASQYMIVLFTMVFVLIERSLFYVKVDEFYSNDKYQSDKFTVLISNINIQISRFLLLKTLISLATAIIIYIAFGIIGVDFTFIWALLTFLFNFIPTIGSIFITLFAVTFSIIQFFPDWTPVLYVVAITVTTQMLVGNFLDPKIMGDNLNLSSLVIWLALLYWGWVWGIMGAFLAVPLTVTMRIICEYVPGLHRVGLSMENSNIILKRNEAAEKKEEMSTDTD